MAVMKLLLVLAVISYALAALMRITDKIGAASRHIISGHSHSSLVRNQNHDSLGGPKLGLIGQISFALALLAHLGAGVLLFVGDGMPAQFSSRAVFLLAAGVLALCCLALEIRSGETFYSIFVMPVVVVLLAFAAASDSVWQNALFARKWFLLHVTAAVAGECFFLMAAIAAATYLVMVRRLKSKNRIRALLIFPPLAQLDRFCLLFTWAGVAAFGFGIAAGAWGWVSTFGAFGLFAPKKVISVFVLLFFALLSAARSSCLLIGPRWSALTIVGFLVSFSVLLVDRGTHWLAP